MPKRVLSAPPVRDCAACESTAYTPCGSCQGRGRTPTGKPCTECTRGWVPCTHCQPDRLGALGVHRAVLLVAGLPTGEACGICAGTRRGSGGGPCLYCFGTGERHAPLEPEKAAQVAALVADVFGLNDVDDLSSAQPPEVGGEA